MAKAKPETIVLMGEPIYKEGQASAVLNPGHLVEFGGAKEVRKQSTAKAVCRRAFALENDLLGKGITDAYAVDERVRYGVFHSGQEVYARVAARAPAIVKGDSLEAKGDGTVQKHTDGEVIAYAVEALDNNAGGSEQFIAIEVA